MKLGLIIRGWMVHEEKSIRELAVEMGVAHGTLWRFLSGKSPDGKTLAQILIYCLEQGFSGLENDPRQFHRTERKA